MGRFASTVPFYERARQPYGPAFFATVAARLGFRRDQRLIDLGTGPGLLALGFAPYVGAVTGVDPETAMLEAAAAGSRKAGVALALVQASAEALPHGIGRFDIVTIGRALHWMEPEATRGALDHLVTADGVVLICSASTAKDGRNPWRAAFEDLRQALSSEAGAGRYDERDAFFAGTRFRPDGVIRVETEQEVSVGTLAERVLSMSSTSPDRVGATIEGVQDAVRRALAPYLTAAGRVHETVEARAEVFRSTAARERLAGSP